VHPGRAGGRANVQQGSQQGGAYAAHAMPRQHHEGKFGRAMLGDIFAVAQHLAIAVNGQHDGTRALTEGIDAVQQGQVGRFAVGEMARVEPLAIHRGEKAADPAAVPRLG